MLEGERVGLIGRNGTGKTSLLKVIAGLAALDDGDLSAGTACVWCSSSRRLNCHSPRHCAKASPSAVEIDHIHDERERWRLEARLVESLHRFGLDPAQAPDTASGGERKRAALALALARQPDLLLLDEPTNHLDIDGITLLEDLLLKGPPAIVITHDRAFLDRVVNRIVELDRGLLRSYPGNFAAYERRKADQLATEGVAHRKFDKFWAQEEVWIRRGIKARRTRNEGRVRRLEQLRRERAARRERLGNVKLTLDAGERSGKLVAELCGVSKRFGERTIVQDLSLGIQRGDRLGLIGPNGAGKSTLLKLILGQLAPDAGEVRLGTNLQVAYFDQMREQLDPEHTLLDTISPGSDWVQIGAERKHVMTYLADFLFPPQRAKAPVKMLSGGERNRLLLARLFVRPANVLVLDEPTNDLDIESLELLEDTLQGYPGTLLLVSHDRAFLDNVVTQTLVAEHNGKWQEYAGGYSDWQSQRPVSSVPAPTLVGEGRERAGARANAARVKLSYKESREARTAPRRDRSARARAARAHRGYESWRLPQAGRRTDQGRSQADRRDRATTGRKVRAVGAARREGRKAPVEIMLILLASGDLRGPCHRWDPRGCSPSLLRGNTERAGVQTARHSVIVHRHDGWLALERRRPAVDRRDIMKPTFTRHYAHWPPARPRSLSLPRTSVYANLEASAQSDPGRCALDYYGDRIAYAELRRQVDALAGFLQGRLGIERGDRVLLYTQNSPQYVIGYYAILRADAVVVPVNPMNRTEEIRHYLEDAGARVMIATQELWGEIAPLLGTSGLTHVVLGAYSDYLSADHLAADHGSADRGPGPSGLPVPEFVRAPRQAISAPGVTAFAEAVAAGLVPREHLARDHDLAVMPYTSGTTGRAKGCVHTHLSVQATASAIGAWRGDARQSVVLAVLPCST